MLNHSRRGVSLLEVLFVLGIMAIILGVVYVTYSLAYSRIQTNDLKDEVMLVLQTADELVENEPGAMFNEWQLKPLLPSKYWSGNNNNTDNGLITSWKSPVNFWYEQGTDDEYYLAVSDIPYSICEQLKIVNWSEFKLTVNTLTCGENDSGYMLLVRNYNSY